MILFSGWKTLAALVVAGLFVAVVAGTGEEPSPLRAGIALVLIGPGLFFFGRWANRPFQGYDQRTGKPATLRPDNSLFLVPLQYWGLILLGLGIVSLASA